MNTRDKQAFPDDGRYGMTMLDWYAGQALGQLSKWSVDPDEVAERAFEIAEAMVERKEQVDADIEYQKIHGEP